MLASELNPAREKLDVQIVKPTDDHIPSMYRTFYPEGNTVTDALKDEIKYWDCRNPVLINAPPGRGKTYWLEHTLIPDAARTNQNVLVLSNRIALSFQQKVDFLRAIDSPEVDHYTPTGLISKEDFGFVKIMTYHHLPTFLNEISGEKQKWLKNLKYVVADEVHAACSDIFFNERCSHYLKLVTSHFQRAIRIYLTATDTDVLYPLQLAEKENFTDFDRLLGYVPPRSFLRYKLNPDYSYLKLNWIDKLDEIKELILANDREKWLIFVDSKKTGESFQESLGDEKALFMDSDSKGTSAYSKLLLECKFDVQCLISTAVLDCGVNIKDQKLRNVVLMVDNRTSFIQMLGRKRVQPGETVNLFVCRPSLEKLNQRRNKQSYIMSYHDRLENAVNNMELRHITQELWKEENPNVRKQFFLSNGIASSDWLCKYMLRKRLDFYTRILDGDTTFEEEVRIWLGLPDHFPKDDYRQKLLEFCQEYTNSPLDEDQVQHFRMLILRAEKQAGISEPQPTRVDKLKQAALSSRLSKLGIPYELPRSEWKIHQKEQ